MSLLYWSMLAAGTVGPGTVVVCARSGVEYQLHLAWTLIFASILAYTLQEGGARLTLVSGKTLGQCLQKKFGISSSLGAPRACWAFSFAVYMGNLLYQCNNFAGGIDAVFAIPGMGNLNPDGVRVVGCFIYGALVLAILYMDKVDVIGVGLGVVMMAMIGLFLAAATTVGFSGYDLLLGLVPSVPGMSSLPHAAAPCEMVLSLVGTTAIGCNIFFSGSMAVGKELNACRRGIAFSTVSTLIVSLLIMVVGSSAGRVPDLGSFNIGLLADSIQQHFGIPGTFAFALGFIAAALSSMLTTIIASALAAEGLIMKHQDADTGKKTQLPRRGFWSIAFSMVAIAMMTIVLNAPRPSVILVAQLFNGVLLPVYSLALLLCITDPQFMSSSPPKRWSILALVGSVTVTLTLAWRVILEHGAILLSVIIGVNLHEDRQLLLFIAAVLGLLSMVAFWTFARCGQKDICAHDFSSDEGSSASGTISGTSNGNATESEGEGQMLRSETHVDQC